MLLRVEALYVPDFGASIFSVPQLIKDGIDISFRSHSRTTYITSEDFTKQPLGRYVPGSMSFVPLGNVTSKKDYPNSTMSQANATPWSNSDSAARADLTCQSTSQADIQTWHQHLVLLNFGNVQKLLPNGSCSKEGTASTTCDICAKAKAKERFRRKVPARQATNTQELIHSNLCGPISPQSRFG